MVDRRWSIGYLYTFRDVFDRDIDSDILVMSLTRATARKEQSFTFSASFAGSPRCCAAKLASDRSDGLGCTMIYFLNVQEVWSSHQSCPMNVFRSYPANDDVPTAALASRRVKDRDCFIIERNKTIFLIALVIDSIR